MTRYSKKLMIQILTDWIAAFEKGGVFIRFADDDSRHYDFKSMDAGIFDAANALMKQITDSPKLTKSMFGDLIAINTPYENATLFTTRTGYAQIKYANKIRSRAYGEFKFNISIVNSIFSDYL
jgi:hypothetical protein